MKKVFFTGHRDTSFYTEDVSRLSLLLKGFIAVGVEDFYAGGAMGWDLLFEKYIAVYRITHPNIKLHLVLPCPPEEQTADWSEKDKKEYQVMLNMADSIETVSPHFTKDCMKKRNQRLAELGDICVCYYNGKRKRSGTGQTVRMAEKMGKAIINIRTFRNEQ